MRSLGSAGNFAASRSTTSPSARNSSLTPIGKVSGFGSAPSRLDERELCPAGHRIAAKARQRAPARDRTRCRGPRLWTRQLRPSSVRMQPVGPRMPVPSLRVGTCRDGTVVNPPFHADVAPFLPPRLPFGAVDSRQDGQCYGNPEERRPQHQDDFQLSAHVYNFRPHRPGGPPADPHQCCAYPQCLEAYPQCLEQAKPPDCSHHVGHLDGEQRGIGLDCEGVPAPQFRAGQDNVRSRGWTPDFGRGRTK